MNKISKINKEQLKSIINFIVDNSDEFNYFKKIGWDIKNIESHFSKNNSYSLGYFETNKLVGILIGDKSYWGNQIGYEAWKLSINYLFSLKQIKKITAGCLVANNAMKKIMIKSNMIFSFNDKVYNKEKNIYEEFVYYEIIK